MITITQVEPNKAVNTIFYIKINIHNQKFYREQAKALSHLFHSKNLLKTL